MGPRLKEGEELKSHNPLELRKLERGETKRSYKDIQQRNDVRHGVSTVHLLHTPIEGPERQEVINKGQSAYPRTRASKKLSTKGQNAYRRTRASRSYQQKARTPIEGPERQKVINKGQSAYPRTRALRSYQQGQSAYRRIGALRSYQRGPEVPNWNRQQKRLT